MSRGGTMGNEVIAIERTHEAKLRRQEIQNIANPPEDPVARAWRLHEEKWTAIEKKHEDDRQRRQNQILAREKAEHERRQKETDKKTFDILLSGLFDQHGATADEQRKVKLLMERNHANALQKIEMWEYVLLRLRGELVGEVSEGNADWRDILRRKK